MVLRIWIYSLLDKNSNFFLLQIDRGTKRDELARNTLGITILPYAFAEHRLAWGTFLISYFSK